MGDRLKRLLRVNVVEVVANVARRGTFVRTVLNVVVLSFVLSTFVVPPCRCTGGTAVCRNNFAVFIVLLLRPWFVNV